MKFLWVSQVHSATEVKNHGWRMIVEDWWGTVVTWPGGSISASWLHFYISLWWIYTTCVEGAGDVEESLDWRHFKAVFAKRRRSKRTKISKILQRGGRDMLMFLVPKFCNSGIWQSHAVASSVLCLMDSLRWPGITCSMTASWLLAVQAQRNKRGTASGVCVLPQITMDFNCVISNCSNNLTNKTGGHYQWIYFSMFFRFSLLHGWGVELPNSISKKLADEARRS